MRVLNLSFFVIRPPTFSRRRLRSLTERLSCLSAGCPQCGHFRQEIGILVLQCGHILLGLDLFLSEFRDESGEETGLWDDSLDVTGGESSGSFVLASGTSGSKTWPSCASAITGETAACFLFDSGTFCVCFFLLVDFSPVV